MVVVVVVVISVAVEAGAVSDADADAAAAIGFPNRAASMPSASCSRFRKSAAGSVILSLSSDL